MTVRLTPGQASALGSEWAHQLASEACRNFRPQLDGSRTEEFCFDPDGERRCRKQRRRQEILSTVPINPDPVPPGLSRAAHVFLNRARSGYALTDDVVARWRHASNRTMRSGNSTAAASEDLSSAVASPSDPSYVCYTCGQSLKPTIPHLVWDCIGLVGPRETHRPAWVLAYEDWIRPKGRIKQTLSALWRFVLDSFMLGHY